MCLKKNSFLWIQNCVLKWDAQQKKNFLQSNNVIVTCISQRFAYHWDCRLKWDRKKCKLFLYTVSGANQALSFVMDWWTFFLELKNRKFLFALTKEKGLKHDWGWRSFAKIKGTLVSSSTLLIKKKKDLFLYSRKFVRTINEDYCLFLEMGPLTIKEAFSLVLEKEGEEEEDEVRHFIK